MRFGLLRIVMVVVVLAFAASHARALVPQSPSTNAAESPLTNASVVKLVRAGFREKTVIAIIRARPVSFDLTPDRLIELKKNGVSEKLILAMIARAEAFEFASDEMSDDDEGFFGDGGMKGQTGGNGPGGGQGSVDIFGSSGGSHGRARTRGGNGGVDNDTQTTGSATVRIIRPPAEAGGASQSKLERTPTLTNDSVVELVEAGFSEGTIIRRIEQSPVEFDLSPTKLTELRRRRVSEPVITAMRAAMGEDGGQPARPEK
jgi:hypothetical protein